MKGRLWCAGCPEVRPARAPGITPLTLIVPYYEQPEFFAFQLGVWRRYPAAVREALSIIVVDDGSPDQPAAAVLERLGRPMNLRLFRIETDIRWNWLAARNIGFHEASPGWCLVTDLDHVVPPETMAAVQTHTFRLETVYAFQRREHTERGIHPHSASFLLTRDLFWKIGGYDERFSGFYGTDGHYRRRLARVAPIVLLPWPLVRYEFVGDSSVTRYQRKQPEDAAVGRIAATVGQTPPKVLSFPFREVPPWATS